MSQPTDEQIVTAICADYDREGGAQAERGWAAYIGRSELGALVREIRRLRWLEGELARENAENVRLRKLEATLRDLVRAAEHEHRIHPKTITAALCAELGMAQRALAEQP